MDIFHCQKEFRKHGGILLVVLLSTFLVSCATKPTSPSLKQVRILPFQKDGAQVYLQFSNFIKEDQIEILEDNTNHTLTVTLKGIETQAPESLEPIGAIKKAELKTVDKNTVLTFTLSEPMTHTLKARAGHANITFIPPVLSEPKPISATTDSAAVQTKYLYRIEDLAFYKGVAGNGELVITSSSPNVRIEAKPSANKLELALSDVLLAETIERRIDTSALEMPVREVTTEENEQGVKIDVAINQPFKHKVNRFNNQIIVEILPVDTTELTKAEQQKNYHGKLLSLNFQNIQVRSLLQLIAEFGGLDMVLTHSVTGNMSMQLEDTPWDQALDIVLKSQGLAERKVGNVVLIGPREEITKRELDEAKGEQEVLNTLPLYTEIIRLHYAKASDAALMLKDKNMSLLSPRGQMSVDARTNSLWIKDIAPNLAEIKKLLKQSDVPVRQILIEGRIVDINSDAKKEIGVRLGLTQQAHRISGTLSGANQLANGTNAAAIDPFTDRLNFDLSANAIDTVTPATIGFSLIKLAGNKLLDLELSALQAENVIEIISTPHLVTSNLTTARIETGEEIPYLQETSSGAASIAFKKAVLSLDVTPQVTPDGRILLEIKINSDSKGTQVTGQDSVPAINTKNIQTKVLLNSGETVVLGGVYKQDKRKSKDEVPGLAKIPIVGSLFRHSASTDDKDELLIFVTPVLLPS